MVYEKVRSILSEQFDTDEEKITLQTDIKKDLNADSLDVADLLTTLEEEFKVEIEDEKAKDIKTVGELVSYIQGRS
ncbi:MAG: acyl carrier protein [Oscillospiraceae bacterium]|jgi:acyl carrier protein|nr:acyl carrier protein [Oscillospiraceae bacterium]